MAILAPSVSKSGTPTTLEMESTPTERKLKRLELTMYRKRPSREDRSTSQQGMPVTVILLAAGFLIKRFKC